MHVENIVVHKVSILFFMMILNKIICHVQWEKKIVLSQMVIILGWKRRKWQEERLKLTENQVLCMGVPGLYVFKII